jgi:hypothetical protein
LAFRRLSLLGISTLLYLVSFGSIWIYLLSVGIEKIPWASEFLKGRGHAIVSSLFWGVGYRVRGLSQPPVPQSAAAGGLALRPHFSRGISSSRRTIPVQKE